MVLPAGFPPASTRLEDGCLMCSATAAVEKWSARQDLHLRSLGPKPSALAATLRADAPAGRAAAGDLVLVETGHLAPWSDARRKIWRTRRDLHPQPSRRQRVAPLLSYGS